MLSFDTLCVTVPEADAYCLARGVGAWFGTLAEKAAALRRGQDYIAGEYNNRWVVSFTDATAPSAVKYAVIEAAKRELTAPFGLAPDVTLGSAKVLTEVDTLKWTPLIKDGKASDMRPSIAAIDNLLKGLIRSMSGSAHFAV